MNHMNDSWFWAQNSKCYEQLKIAADMNDLMFWAQGSKYYEQLRVVVDINDYESWGALDVMNNWGLWMISTTSGHEHRALNTMNRFKS